MGAETEVHWQYCCKNCYCTVQAPLCYHSVPHGVALLQSAMKSHQTVFYIHFIFTRMTTDGKV